ncbi:MAG: hypothetical protein ACRYG2_13860, partial [Janthinobacterium lividum]
ARPGRGVEEDQVQDFSYGQAYADWQGELRASAARAPSARRDARDRSTGSRGARLRGRGAWLRRMLPRPRGLLTRPWSPGAAARR